MSSIAPPVVTGMNDRGDLVGLIALASGSTPFVYEGGTFSYPVLPANLIRPAFEGINDSGLVYGQGRDASSRLFEVFTLMNGQATVLPLSAPGLVSFRTGFGWLKTMPDCSV